MSSTDRQNQLFVAEDWKKIYQTFRNAEFKSYDFDNLRRIMISYLKENYPEDFNDYIESSEYIALIDLIAFLGQNLSFRIDLNARENFIELAERKESVLRLARLLSYNPKRNQGASGLLKLTAVSTTEELFSSKNVNLRGQTVVWNDSVNHDWQDQFNRILNAAFSTDNQIGSPIKLENVSGIQTALYQIQKYGPGVPVYPFRRTIRGSSVNFEVVSANIDGDIKEYAPNSSNGLSLLYRSDSQGPSGDNTGFFCMFKQGELNASTFNVENNVPNQKIKVDVPNINNDDVWLYSLDSNDKEDQLWINLPSVIGGNVIYNISRSGDRNVYSVLTQENDKIDLMFSDGDFGNIPFGKFKVFYRTSKNQNMLIEPSSMRNVTITIPYVSKRGVEERITFTLSLKYTVSNASVSETTQSIRKNAPATYYTQNRLISGEDYQLGLSSISQDIIKSKTVNRSTSGLSRYYDLTDPTGKYSNVTLFGSDGVLYKKYYNRTLQFQFGSENDVEGIVYNRIEKTFSDSSLLNYYMELYPRVSVRDFEITWESVSNNTNENTGFFIGVDTIPIRLGVYSTSRLKHVKFNSLVKFIPPEGHVFLNDEIVPYSSGLTGIRYYKWVKIVNVVGDGTDVSNAGPVTINDRVPSGSLLEEIITPLPNRMVDEVRYRVMQHILSYKTFGLRYSQDQQMWTVISQNNLDTTGTFSTLKAGDSTNNQLDSSWFIMFKSTGQKYTMHQRSLDYIFESDREIQFYYDSHARSTNANIEDDIIDVLPINTMPDSERSIGNSYVWKIEKEYLDLSGYSSNKKIILSLYDSDKDGVIDDPDIFRNLVDEHVNSVDKLVFLKSTVIDGVLNDYVYINKDSIDVIIFRERAELRNLNDYKNGQLFYFIKENVFENSDLRKMKLLQNTNYLAYYGRNNIHFRYVHHADHNSRIDPGRSNLMDAYILTQNYDQEFRKFLNGGRADVPLPPSNNSLKLSYESKINNIKSISDDIVFHSAKYRILFGESAYADEQAVFKLVKNADIFINDNELKSNVVGVIKQYFSIENWDFGDTFYFSELSAYVMTKMVPYLKSFLIVPVSNNLSFGAMHEIKCESNEIFTCQISVRDIEIISEITGEQIKSQYDTYASTRLNTDRQVISSY